MIKKIETLDSTLRDGAQARKVIFSVSDKLKIITLLDELGVDYIEIGSTFSEENDSEFTEKVEKLSLAHSRLVSFGSTCRKGIKPEDDPAVVRLAESPIEVCTIFGKAWDLHVSDILDTTKEENLRMVRDTVEYLVSHGKRVIFDAEHFFDGFISDSEYAISVLKVAADAGAERVVLCDTNGGMFPEDIYTITEETARKTDLPLGIHVHNDGGLAVAGTIRAVEAGATHVQGTINGVGERCGNVNLATVIANLQLKRSYELISPENMRRLSFAARAVAEISNISIRNFPYVSKQAFSHKAGTHIDGVMKNPRTFEHIDPNAVGNERNFLLSGIAGKNALLHSVRKFLPNADKDSPEVQEILARIKELEHEGYQYDAADASLELIIRRALGKYKKHFDIELCRLIDEYNRNGKTNYSSIFLKVFIGDNEEITAADSDGPVHAMDIAMRKALETYYPVLHESHLTDYKVRVLNSEAATGATTRVLIETTQNGRTWTTIGVSVNIIQASLLALVDSIEYQLQED